MFVGISSAGIITAKFAEFLVRTAREDAAADASVPAQQM
jgi:hypothetical protein